MFGFGVDRVVFRMEFASLIRVMFGMKAVRVGYVRVMARLLMVPFRMGMGCSPVVLGCVLVVFCRLVVVLYLLLM